VVQLCMVSEAPHYQSIPNIGSETEEPDF
jgi:hypothetical protein